MDKIVFDIETKSAPEGYGDNENLEKLEISVIGVYSYEKNTYFVFDENELDKLVSIFKNAYLIIGFSSERFDVPVLQKHIPFPLTSIPHFDILKEIKERLGRRIGLGVLAEANLGIGKSGHGLEAIEMYERGEFQKLKDYCLQDVKVTKEIYDLIKERKYLWIPEKDSPIMNKLDFSDFKEIEPPQPKLI